MLKPNGVFAVVGYGLLAIKDVRINALVQKLYYQTLKGYWDAERKYIDEEYLTIPFPFQEIDVPKLSMEYSWSAAQLLDYLNTWSAIKHYKMKNEDDPLATLKMALTEQDVSYEIEFPILLRIGR